MSYFDDMDAMFRGALGHVAALPKKERAATSDIKTLGERYEGDAAGYFPETIRRAPATQFEFAGHQRVPEAYSGDHSKSMTVAELRELLSRFPDSALVNCTCEGGSCTTRVYGLSRYGMEQELPGSEPVLTVTLEGY